MGSNEFAVPLRCCACCACRACWARSRALALGGQQRILSALALLCPLCLLARCRAEELGGQQRVLSALVLLCLLCMLQGGRTGWAATSGRGGPRCRWRCGCRASRSQTGSWTASAGDKGGGQTVWQRAGGTGSLAHAGWHAGHARARWLVQPPPRCFEVALGLLSGWAARAAGVLGVAGGCCPWRS